MQQHLVDSKRRSRAGVGGNFVECRVLFDCNCRILLLFACFRRRRRKKLFLGLAPLDEDIFFVVAQYNNTEAEGVSHWQKDWAATKRNNNNRHG